MTVEAAAAIVFGVLQLCVGLIALWQQYQLRRIYRMSTPVPLEYLIPTNIVRPQIRRSTTHDFLKHVVSSLHLSKSVSYATLRLASALRTRRCSCNLLHLSDLS